MLRDITQITRQRLLEQAAFTGKRVLEIGCGPGRITRMYAAEPELSVGVEPDPEAVRTAAAEVPEALIVCASGMDLPFRPQTFDVVLFTLSLHHHPDPAAALIEARSVLADDGRILVLEPTSESEVQRLCLVFEDEDRQLEAVERMLAQSDLNLLSRTLFKTHWVFRDFDDVADFGFGFYNEPPNPEKRQALRAKLGRKADSRPIEMTDTLCLTCLGV